jgi:hypothetical protein
MANLHDIINLAKADGGKFFVLDESGEVSAVILPIADYQKLLLGKLQKQVVDIENINSEILKAQLQEPEEIVPEVEKPIRPPAQPRVYQAPRIERQDLRAEVIDPSFDFEAPKMDDDF